MLSKEKSNLAVGLIVGATIGVALCKKSNERKIKQIEAEKDQMYSIMQLRAKGLFDTVLNAYEQHALGWYVKSDVTSIERGNAIADLYNKLLDNHAGLMGLGLNYAVNENKIPSISAKGSRYSFNVEPLELIDIETWEEQNL